MDERSLSHATDFASHCLLCAQEACYEDSCTRGDGKSGSIQPLQIGEGDSEFFPPLHRDGRNVRSSS